MKLYTINATCEQGKYTIQQNKEHHKVYAISVSEILAEHEIMQTLVHEIAHALTKGHGHDRVWAAKCRELGGTGEAYYNRGDRQVVNPNKERTRSSKTYSVYCQGCGYDFPFYTRKRKSNNLTHTGCGGKVICIERG